MATKAQLSLDSVLPAWMGGKTHKNVVWRWSLYISLTFVTLFIMNSLFHNTHDRQEPPDVTRVGENIVFGDTPICSIWSDFREKIPSSRPADDAAFYSARLGTSDVVSSLPGQGCVPAQERFGPFGHSTGEGLYPERPWSDIRWGNLQSSCASVHAGSANVVKPSEPRGLVRSLQESDRSFSDAKYDDLKTGRTAAVLRTWDGYDYTEDQKAWLRALIAELSLDTGGKYQVFMLVDVKDDELDIRREDVYQEVLDRSVPEEFRDMTFLFNRALLESFFPNVGEHDAHYQMYQALQIFSHSFPEFDYVWQLEMDVRFTGNIMQMLENAGHWASKQPRKNLWERNGQFYVPELSGSHAQFSASVDEQFEGVQGIWGPHPYAEFYVDPQGPSVPDRTQEDWGIGEPAELITFAPMVDPVGSGWVYEDEVHAFESPLSLPRRMAMISITRSSRRLLRLISAEQHTSGAWVASESTPETWSLLHGLKAVYVPHLIGVDIHGEDAEPANLDRWVNKGPAWDRAGGKCASFMWCPASGLGDENWHEATYFWWNDKAVDSWREYLSGICTYPLILHPVKEG